jgi:hypothetical protein
VNVDCKNWAHCNVPHGGCCTLGLFGGRPSVGTCARCDKRDPGPPRPAAVAAENWSDAGPRKWASLHSNDNITAEWLDEFEKDFPPACGCLDHWRGMLKAAPPPLGDRDAMRRWTWERHNEVNARLSKPVVTFEAAAARWGWSDCGADCTCKTAMKPKHNPRACIETCRLCPHRMSQRELRQRGLPNDVFEGMLCRTNEQPIGENAKSGECPRQMFPHQQAVPVSVRGRDVQSTAPPPRPTRQQLVNLATVFDRVFFINLDRRTDRLSDFWSRFPADWPHARPERIAAYDGRTLAPPREWESGHGAWGCTLSHQKAIGNAIADERCHSVLVMEDDAEPTKDYAARAALFFDKLPTDWQMLWIGNQNLAGYETLNPWVIAPHHPHRMHAYALRGKRIMEFFLARLRDCEVHCDHCVGRWSNLNIRTYAAEPTLIYQGKNKSDIDGNSHGRRF